MPTYKITYYDFRGRAELLRLIFAVAGVEYEDERLTVEQVKERKPKLPPQGQLPVLTIDGSTVITQSLSIARFLAKEFDLAGKTNLENTKCDEIIQTVEDLRLLYIRIFFEQDKEKKAELEKKMQDEDLPKYLKIFEQLLEQNGDNGFFVGDSLSVADLTLHDFFESLVMTNPEVLSTTPKLQAHRKKVEEMDRIKKYVSKRPKTDY